MIVNNPLKTDQVDISLRHMKQVKKDIYENGIY